MEIRKRRLGTAVILAVLLASPVLLVSSPIGAAATQIAKTAEEAGQTASSEQRVERVRHALMPH